MGDVIMRESDFITALDDARNGDASSSAEISATTQSWTKRLCDPVSPAIDSHLRRNEWFGWCGTRRKSSMVPTLAETTCKACITRVEMYRRRVMGETDD